MMYDSDNQQEQMAQTDLFNETPLNRVDHH
jgi:hypothetical protein